MARGRKSPFQGLPLGRQCLYAAEMTNGMVKVGLTRNPASRIRALQTETRKHYDADITRYSLSVQLDAPHLLFAAEAELLNALRLIATLSPGHTEYFSNLRFEVAVALMEEVVGRYQSSVESTNPSVRVHEPDGAFF